MPIDPLYPFGKPEWPRGEISRIDHQWLFNDFEVYFKPRLIRTNVLSEINDNVFGDDFITNFEDRELPLYQRAIRVYEKLYHVDERHMLYISDKATTMNGKPLASHKALMAAGDHVKRGAYRDVFMVLHAVTNEAADDDSLVAYLKWKQKFLEN